MKALLAWRWLDSLLNGAHVVCYRETSAEHGAPVRPFSANREAFSFGSISPSGKDVPAVKTIYYKAVDASGGKHSGTVEAANLRSADQELRSNGLRPYFLHDYRELKAKIRRKKKRQKIIVACGSLAIALSLLLSGALVGYAGRERPPDIESYQKGGLILGASSLISAASEEEREFGLRIREVWDSFTEETITGVEVSKVLLTVYVNKKIRRLPQNDLEVLSEHSIRALQRRFGAVGCNLLVVEGGRTILEVQYNGITKKTTIRSWQ